ncbi:MAG TPA: hypothetical protein VK324_05905 [Tepidisphaeraceae bacterium]|nr:hypothetical protein [Tepidisphaeraceae bacterium]
MGYIVGGLLCGRHFESQVNVPVETVSRWLSAGGTTIDIVLRPSPDVARRAANLVTIWGQPVVMEGIPVVVGENPSRSATTRTSQSTR